MSHTNPMPQIETIVYLTLENRSLDTMLGWLYSGRQANASWPPGSSLTFDGILPGAANSFKGAAVGPTRGTRDLRVPHWNPNEVFEHVAKQMYVDGDGKGPGGEHDSAYPWGSDPKMDGFVWDFESLADKDHLSDVMGAYTREQLPVLYGLAENYAVSDRWFCSVPTETNPNRAFAVCGTSLGAEDNGDPNASNPKGDTFVANTIFNTISGKRSWGIYWQYNGLGSMDPGKSCYTSDSFPQIANATGGEIETYATFLAKLQAGKLPEFCYLEPYWGGGAHLAFLQGNDYHPPQWVGPCEVALNALFENLLASPQWPHMLLILTFDEHGGTWDHVAPPRTIQPDSYNGKSGFDFTRMGPRVPTILISPWVEKGTVFRATADDSADFDHTSVLATVCKWAGIDPAEAKLGARTAQAPTFDGVLTNQRRTDRPPPFTVPFGYDDQGGGVGHFNVIGIHTDGPVDLTGVDIDTFRRLEKESSDSGDFVRRLQGLQPAASKRS